MMWTRCSSNTLMQIVLCEKHSMLFALEQIINNVQTKISSRQNASPAIFRTDDSTGAPHHFNFPSQAFSSLHHLDTNVERKLGILTA